MTTPQIDISAVKSQFPIVQVFARFGLTPNKAGKICCPFHNEKTPSCQIYPDTQKFYCYGCQKAGDIFDVILALEGKGLVEACEWLGYTGPSNYLWPEKPVLAPDPFSSTPTPRPRVTLQMGKPTPKKPKVKPEIVGTHNYVNEIGDFLYQVVKLIPKTFRQRHKAEDGKWIWNMDNVARVLYNLPDVISSQVVCIAEGEGDCDRLSSLGYTATTNVGGAGKWMDAYVYYLKDKDVILFWDNDHEKDINVGAAHRDQIIKSLTGKVDSVTVINLPDGHKDIKDYLAEFDGSEESEKAAVEALISKGKRLDRGIESDTGIGAKFWERLGAGYCLGEVDSPVDLAKTFPRIAETGRRFLYPGELMGIIGRTGSGKSALVMNMIIDLDIPVIIFNIELNENYFGGRMLQIKNKCNSTILGQRIAAGKADFTFGDKVALCSSSKVTVEYVRQEILLTEARTNVRPQLFCVDYLQLMGGPGDSEYERVSANAEGLKALTLELDMPGIFVSQCSRPAKGSSEQEPSAYDAKGSGSIENSAQLLMSIFKERDNQNILGIRVLKNTRGSSGEKMCLDINWDQMRMWPNRDNRT